MNNKKAKALKREAERFTVGANVDITNKFYRELKMEYKKNKKAPN